MNPLDEPPSAASPEIVLAFAKLTLSLRVSGVRPDGYHLLDAEMVNVDLADSLHFSAGEGLEVVMTSGAARAGSGAVPADGSNLVARALALLGRRAHVRLVKRIPAGAGLGGGSADAAAVLRWAGATGSEGLATAARLGADVPFCLAGEGRARVRGAGELVEPLAFDEVAAHAYTLAIPPFGVPTAAVYQVWDEMGGPTGDNFNDLEPAALRVEPRLAEWRDRLAAATGQVPRLAGSGSSWFVAGDLIGEGPEEEELNMTVVRVVPPSVALPTVA